MSIWSDVKTALTGLNVPLAANVYRAASDAELPDQFITYFLISSPPVQAADDAETLRSNRVQVTIYDRDGLNSLPDVASAMVAAGFSRGPERELSFNPLTGHYGLAAEFVILKES